MLICDHWFYAVFTRQPSGRERTIVEKSKKVEKYSQKNVYLGIAYNTLCVCVCLCL